MIDLLVILFKQKWKIVRRTFYLVISTEIYICFQFQSVVSVLLIDSRGVCVVGSLIGVDPSQENTCMGQL